LPTILQCGFRFRAIESIVQFPMSLRLGCDEWGRVSSPF
jgi:hypothetical protein